MISMEDNKKVAKAQGAETQKKEQAKSVSYAVTAIKGHVETLQGAGLLTEEQAQLILEIRRQAWMKMMD